MPSLLERMFIPHTPWLARLKRRGYWQVVCGFSVLFGAGFAVVLLAIGETAATAAVIGLFVAILLLGGGALLWGELRAFWPERR